MDEANDILLGEEARKCSFSSTNNACNAPETGMKFHCDNCVYEYYKGYGHRIGFSIRKRFVKRTKNGLVKRRTVCCSKQGEHVEKEDDNVGYRRPISRRGCLAHITCQLTKDGMLIVVSFEEKHNHEFPPSPMKHMLRTRRRISRAQKAIAADAEKSGIPIKSTLELLSRQAGGRENLGFLEEDYRNLVHTTRRAALEKGDGQAIMDYFKKIKEKEPSYFYDVQFDDDNFILNIFWADSRSIADYKDFGDVICFDTTYRTNSSDRPFAPFVGVNHHKQTILLGAALLYDETVESFKWLFQTFLTAMSGRKPVTILTDQSAAMAKAIAEVFPETHHRLCVWHIYQNAAKHLSHVFSSSKSFANDFGKCIYDFEDEDEWLKAWNEMLQNYQLVGNKWLEGIFSVKEKWAMVYGRHTFTADMKTTQRSESMNNVLKKYLKPSHSLLRFLEHYCRVLDDKRYAELRADFKMKQTTPVLQVNVEILRHAAEIYTPEVFQMFQGEYLKVWDCSLFKIEESEIACEYKVKYRQNSHEHLVSFEVSTTTIRCSCMKFTFVGILCAHALKVLDRFNIKKLPNNYIIRRWKKDARDGTNENYQVAALENSVQDSIGKRYSQLSHIFHEISTLAAEDKMMYNYASNAAENLHKDLLEMLQRCHASTVNGCSIAEDEVNNEFADLQRHNISDTCANSFIVHGIRTKATVGRPKRRLKSVLEGRKNGKSQNKSAKKRVEVPSHQAQLSKVQGRAFQINDPRQESHEQTQLVQFYEPRSSGSYYQTPQNRFLNQNIQGGINADKSDSSYVGQLSFTELLQGGMLTEQ